MTRKKFFIKTFGCQQNISDSERISGYYEKKGYLRVLAEKNANIVIINTCSVRQRAEDKFTGFVYNLTKIKNHKKNFKIIVTGCIAGTAINDQSGKILRILKSRYPYVDHFVPVQRISDYSSISRANHKHAFIPISNGCNNFCSYCIVPFARGREISLSFKQILKTVDDLSMRGYNSFTLLGQNVNSYGSDLVISSRKFKLPNGKFIRPQLIDFLGKKRIPTLFPALLEEICKNSSIKNIDFVSSNPWDFSDKLISVIASHKIIDRTIHLPVQSGSNRILKKMNRWHTSQQYLALIKKMRAQIPGVKFITDIIVGFPGETKKDFMMTKKLMQQVKFSKAFIACYSPRPGTLAARLYRDNVPAIEKQRRFRILDKSFNHKKWDHTPAWIRPAD